MIRCCTSILTIAVFAGARPASAEVTCFAPISAPGALTFTASQAGVPLKGSFAEFDAEICLDLESGDTPGRVAVRVSTASVKAGFPELDEALKGPDFFDSQRWPDAVFESELVEPAGEDRYAVSGDLTIRDITHTVEVMLDWQASSDGNAPRLSGSMTVNRLDYDVGLGEWQDTRWVGDEVTLEFDVVLRAQ